MIAQGLEENIHGYTTKTNKKAKQFYCTMTYNNTQTKHQDKERTKK